MPRGLMIKRRKGASAVSYRLRTAEEHTPGLSALFPGTVYERAETPPLAAPVQFRKPEAVHVLHNPTLPVSYEYKRHFSHVTPESLTVRAALPESGLVPRITSSRTDFGSKPSRLKEHRRKTPVRDDVTASPVLGLKIKDAASEPRPHTTAAGLVCQLCSETFPDPFALAQHHCSRIVRVEYLCDCGKAFSCSANLASHRRWHRPRVTAYSDSTECARCRKRFKTVASLRKHEARHENTPINLSACHREAVTGHAPVLMRALST